MYGVVSQNGGFVNVTTEPARGTTFDIYLPRYTGPEEAQPGAEVPVVPIPTARHEVVLLVEDEPAVLRMVTAALTSLGYRVLAAASPGDALRLATMHSEPIHVMLTDVVMPQMNGRDLADRVKAAHPELTCVFMSGYTADVIAHRGVLDDGIFFIQKPFATAALSAKLREAVRWRARSPHAEANT